MIIKGESQEHGRCGTQQATGCVCGDFPAFPPQGVQRQCGKGPWDWHLASPSWGRTLFPSPAVGLVDLVPKWFCGYLLLYPSDSNSEKQQSHMVRPQNWKAVEMPCWVCKTRLQNPAQWRDHVRHPRRLVKLQLPLQQASPQVSYHGNNLSGCNYHFLCSPDHGALQSTGFPHWEQSAIWYGTRGLWESREYCSHELLWNKRVSPQISYQISTVYFLIMGGPVLGVLSMKNTK